MHIYTHTHILGSGDGMTLHTAGNMILVVAMGEKDTCKTIFEGENTIKMN